MRYTLSWRPVTSSSDSNLLLRSAESSCLWKQLGDVAGGCSATVDPKSLIEVRLRGREGDLRNNLSTRPVTSLSNSNRPCSCPSKQRGDDASLSFQQSPWVRPRGDSSAVPVMVLGVMKEDQLESSNCVGILYAEDGSQGSSPRLGVTR